MNLKESAPPSSIPAPREPGEAHHPITRRASRSGRRRWARRLAAANTALCVVALVVLVTAYADYRADHPHGIDLSRGIDELAWMLGSGVIAAFALGNFLIRPYTGATWRIWVSSGWFAGLCLAGIATCWALVFHDTGADAVPGTQVHDDREVAAFLDQAHSGSVPRIPTGTFIQSVKFSDANDVSVTGYVWQRYGPSTPAGLTQGVVLPEAGNAYAAREVYRLKQGDVETVGWNFEATVRQRFDYSDFPLDSQSVWLRMRPANVTRAAVLVPDFQSYPPWRLDAKYGLDPGFVNGGWMTHFTTFSFVANDYTASFGTAKYGDQRPFPELYFNVGMARDFVGPLVARLVPVAFIVLLIFASLFVITLDAERRGVFGFTVFSVIGFAVSMLLVITMQHTSVRESTGESGLVYLEYFYAALYAVILLVALNALLLPSSLADRVLDWRGNLVPKVLYWPVFLGLVLAATLYSFAGP